MTCYYSMSDLSDQSDQSTLSDTSTLSDSNFSSDIEFDEAIEQLEEMTRIQTHALSQLSLLQDHINPSIRITVNGTSRDLIEIMEELHAAALQEIQETGHTTFSTILSSRLS